MSDILPVIKPTDANPLPRCPLCGADMMLTPMHKAVEAVTNVFRCTACGVQYPMVKQKGESV